MEKWLKVALVADDRSSNGAENEFRSMSPYGDEHYAKWPLGSA